MDKEKTSAPENSPKPKKSLKLMIIAGAGLLVLLLIGGGVAFFLLSSSSSSPDSSEGASFTGKIKGIFSGGEKKPETLPIATHKMDPFLVNLADPGQLRYLKVTLHVETPTKAEEYEKKLPQLRDSVLGILSSKQFKDILTSDGKNVLREEIKGAMNQILVEAKVRNIYFTEFVIQ
jgi:flagellar protein FliL